MRMFEPETLDGIRVDFPDGWGLVRASNTTPVLVLRFEGQTQLALDRIEPGPIAEAFLEDAVARPQGPFQRVRAGGVARIDREYETVEEAAAIAGCAARQNPHHAEPNSSRTGPGAESTSAREGSGSAGIAVMPAG